MKKIITGMLGIVGTLVVVGGIAYAAAFGHVDATASATTTNDLLIYDNATSSYITATDLSSGVFSKLTTVGNSEVLNFENQTSTPTTGLAITLDPGFIDNSSIASDIQIAFAPGTATAPTTAWLTLPTWETTYDLDGVVIPANASGNQQVTMFVRLDPTLTSAGTSSYSVTGIDFDFGPIYAP